MSKISKIILSHLMRWILLKWTKSVIQKVSREKKSEVQEGGHEGGWQFREERSKSKRVVWCWLLFVMKKGIVLQSFFLSFWRKSYWLLLGLKVLPFLFIDAQESEPWASGACSINKIHVAVVEDRPQVTAHAPHPPLASLCRWTV